MKLLSKKSFIISSIIVSMMLIANVFVASSTYAEGTYVESRCDFLLGLTSWDCGVNITDEASMKAGIWTIAANVATDITIIAAYLILAFVIYGGYLYMFSSGDSARVAAGKKTLFHAFIGLAIVMAAYIIVGSIRIALVGGSGNISNCFSQSGCVDANQMVTNLIQWVVGIAGVVAVIFLIYGGVLYMTSSGDVAKTKQARTTILYAVIGLIIVAIAEIITAFVSGIIRENTSTALMQNNTIISKEITQNEKIH